MKITVNDTVWYVFDNGRAEEAIITSAYKEKDCIVYATTVLDVHKCPTKFYSNSMSGRRTYSYNRDENFKVFLSAQDAADYKRIAVIKELDTLKQDVEAAMLKLKKHRSDYFEILNSTDANEWIACFQKHNKF